MSKRVKNEYIPDVVTSPGETLQQTLESLGMTKAELAARIGKTPKTVGEIINHDAQITPSVAIELEKVLGIPASFWNNRERRYRESLARHEERNYLQSRTEWLKTMPVREMIKAGWINEHKDKIEQLREVLRFFGISSPQQWEQLWRSPDAAYRKSECFESNPQINSAWIRKGELQAAQIPCESYDRENFRKALKMIRELARSEPDRFQDEMIHLCARAGVAVIFTPPIKGLRIYGVTRWLTSEKAMIQLSLRGKYEDIFWFTFFHEAGHILLHGKKDIFIHGENDLTNVDKELEADRFASDFLIPPVQWQKILLSDYHSENSIVAFAKEIGISPAIVVGRLQHEKRVQHSHFNGLRRRYEFS